jgi:dolichol-phosphate mannosyltransferase
MTGGGTSGITAGGVPSTAAPVSGETPALVSVVVPVYCEEGVVERTYRELTRVLEGMAGYRHEIVFVDDGSTDDTLPRLKRLAAADPRVKVITFSRNFGHQIAISAGIDTAEGDAVVIIDADLQDPPTLIPDMLRLWRQGNAVVYGRRTAREGETWFKKRTATWFYALLNRLAEVEIPRDTGDFRLLDRRVVAQIRGLREQHRFLRGLVSWIGYRQTALEYVRAPRQEGETKYSLRAMTYLALDGILSFSSRPLRLATNFGLLSIVVAFGLLVYGLVRYVEGDVVRGWTSTIVTILFLGGIQLFTIGIIGEYLSRIYDEIKGRPLYIVDETINVRPRGRVRAGDPDGPAVKGAGG